MTVVDMRNFFTDCKVHLIEIGENKIYYAEQKKEEGHESLFVLEYDRQTQTERIVANYILNNVSYQRHYFAFAQDIVVVMERGDAQAWVLRIDKETGAEKNLSHLHLIGDFSDCKALDAEHILFFTVPNREHESLFAEYQSLTGFPQVVYLYDLKTETYAYLKDPRFCYACGSQIVPYQHAGEPWLLLTLPFGSEKEKEALYHQRDSLSYEACDQVWTCPLTGFFEDAKQGREVSMTLLFQSGTDGLLRYAGMDGQNLYFRARHFPSEDQRICMVNRDTFEKGVAVMLNLLEQDEPSDFLIDTAGGQVYRLTRHGEQCEIEGVLNSKVKGSYTTDLGDFIACVEDRFLIARYVLSDESDSFEFNFIFDLLTREKQSFESRCAVQKNTVVLY